MFSDETENPSLRNAHSRSLVDTNASSDADVTRVRTNASTSRRKASFPARLADTRRPTRPEPISADRSRLISSFCSSNSTSAFILVSSSTLAACSASSRRACHMAVELISFIVAEERQIGLFFNKIKIELKKNAHHTVHLKCNATPPAPSPPPNTTPSPSTPGSQPKAARAAPKTHHSMK